MKKRDQRWLAAHTAKLLHAAVRENYDEASQLLGEIGYRCGHFGVYLLCRSMCAAVHRQACPDMPIGDGSLTGPLAVVQVRAVGVPQDVAEQAAEHSPGMWASRFVVAYLNGDRDTTQALFASSLDDRDRAIENVETLITLAATVVRDSGAEVPQWGGR